MNDIQVNDLRRKILYPTVSGIITGVVVFLMTGLIAEQRGREEANAAFVQKLESAPTVYAKRLSELINSATSGKSQDILVDARAVVSTRNELRKTLTSLSDVLNSEIDRLERELQEAEQQSALRDGYSDVEIKRTLEVLKKKWPAKTDQIVVELRKLLAEMGLEPKELG